MKVLVLCASEPFGLGLIRCLGRVGHEVHVWGSHPNATYRLSRFCKKYAFLRVEDVVAHAPRLIDAIDAYAKEHGIDAIVPADIRTTHFLCAIGPRLRNVRSPFPLPTLATFELVDDKATFAQILRDASLPMPRTLDASASASERLALGFPMIAKPAAGEGGIGVETIDSPEALDTYLARAGDRRTLLQEFIPGQDIDLSFLADHGRIVAYSIQVGHMNAATKIFLHHNQVLDIGRSFAAATGFHGVAHVDMRQDDRDGSIRAIECNPRFWGSLEHSLWAGVNFPALALEMASGAMINQPVNANAGPCTDSGVQLRRLIGALVQGRSSPSDLPPLSRVAWNHNHTDPLPGLARNLKLRAKSLRSRK